MINLCNTEPPRAVEVNGGFYSIDYDFTTWIEVTDLLEHMDKNDPEDQAEKFIKIENLVFGKIIDEPIEDVLDAVYKFSLGYPNAVTAKREYGEDVPELNEEPKISYKYDLSYIIIAIRNQSGIDLSYRRKEPFHWWEFLLEVETLDDSHYISRLKSIRGYKGDDKDQRRIREYYRLPLDLTDEEREFLKNNL